MMQPENADERSPRSDIDVSPRVNTSSPDPPLPPPRRLTQETYDIRSINSCLDEFVEVLSDPRYQEIHGDYPVDDLMSVVSMVSATIEEYKEHSQHTQEQLVVLRGAMKTVKENLHLSITREAFHLNADERKTVEELELEAKLTEVSAAVAEAHADVAQANKLSAETNQTAVQANLLAVQAKNEAQRIQEEIELKAERERKKREEEERLREEEARKREEEERKREEDKRIKEETRRRQEEAHSGWKQKEEMSTLEHWTPHAYTGVNGSEVEELQCVVRAHPAHFSQNDVRCGVISQSDVSVTYGEQEELVSRIVELTSTDDSKTAPVEAIYVALPYLARLPMAREAVVKTMEDGKWVDLVTQDVVLDGYKEHKFAQAKVSHFGKFLVMSRFRRDYLSVQNTRRMCKLASSYDHRVVLTVPKNTFQEKEHLVLQVQPVDSNTVGEFRGGDKRGKGLLTSSPILHTEWDTGKLDKPINVTLPCPPNPAKAKKLALLKKQKEEKMKNPVKPSMLVEEMNKPKKAAPQSKLQQQQQQAKAEAGEGADGEAPPPRQNKWYMGQYGQSEDDENDHLRLMTCCGGRWTYAQRVDVIQAKIDLVSFDLDVGCERLMVLRTRTDVEEENLKHMAQGLEEQLARRSVRVIMKQRADDPYDVCCHVVPTSGEDRVEKALKADGYTDGPDKHHAASLREGDSILLQLRGNLRFQDLPVESSINLVYNSNLPTQASFHLSEVDRYLQRNYEVFRGAVRVVRRYEVVTNPKLRRAAEEECALPVYKTDVICDIDIDIPKYHVDPDSIPRRVPVVLHDGGPVGNALLKQLAEDLGEEWQRLAAKLNVHRVRLQAILRTVNDGTLTYKEGSVNANDGVEDQAKYEMLITWLKRCPQAADKVTILSNALLTVGRKDLAIKVKHRARETHPPVLANHTSPLHHRQQIKTRVH